MTPDEFIKDIRNEINEPSGGGFFTDFELMALVNRAQDLVQSKIVEADQNFFEQSDQSLAFILNQEEYDLPNLAWDRKITRVTRTDLPQPKQLSGIRFQEKERYHAANVFLSGSDTQGDVYYLRNNKIGIKPTPQMNYTPVNGLGNILIHYIQEPQEVHVAQPKSLTSTSFIMPTTTSGNGISSTGTGVVVGTGLLLAGRISTKPNYYVNARIRFISDGVLSRGSEAIITGWNVQTKLVTFAPAVNFSDVPYGSVCCYVILSSIPVEYHDVMFQYAVWRAAKKKGDQGRAMDAKDVFTKLWDSLVNTIEPRKYDENSHVRTPVDMHFD